MKVFRVWLSRLDGASGLRVNGLENTTWLIRRLSDFFVFKTSDPLGQVVGSSDFTFRVADNSQMSGPGFASLLAGIREVKVIVEPGSSAPKVR